ncbi:cytosolic protein [Peribacillus deserti]|uniref:Cytosolic protein n=1 Tax=Peribacillus deserti TaxID=673318 RepID=A0A2N5M8B4_9BACI|nr:cytosolic protein [Peribacillus deserti]PLT30586.1 cytosolic protein [Peribacillus deserti]
MKSFVVSFHQEDNVDTMQIQKLDDTEFDQATEGGARHLFDLDTNIGYFIFMDAEDIDGDVSHLMIQFEGDNESPSAYYSFSLQDFYEFMALFLSGQEPEDEEEEGDEQEYGPMHHLGHLLHHIVEEGNSLKP